MRYLSVLAILASLAFLILSGCSDSTGSDNNSVIDSSEMVFVEGETFMMGCRDSLGEADEYPLHEVTVSDFYIGKYEVTEALWEQVMEEMPIWMENPRGDNYPVTQFPPCDARDFCDQLSILHGLEPCYYAYDSACDFSKNGYRLPTEAEWEYAARGGQLAAGCQFAGSDDIREVGWTSNSENWLHVVGLLQPNEIGAYDMSGNAWEICNDWYTATYYNVCYDQGAVIDPEGPDKPSGTPEYVLKYVLRGGCCLAGSSDARNSEREDVHMIEMGDFFTFRLARNAD